MDKNTRYTNVKTIKIHRIVPASLKETEDAKYANPADITANIEYEIIERIQYLFISSVERLKTELKTA